MSSANLALPVNHRVVLDVVRNAGDGSHLTAADIWSRARQRAPQIGFATVHRSLIRLQDAGAIMKIDVPGEAAAVYEPAASPHAHFRCSRCGSISDLAYAVPAETLAALSARHRFSIEAESVTFTGRCAGCA